VLREGGLEGRRVAQEGVERLLRPVDPDLGEDAVEPVADLGGAGRPAGRVEREAGQDEVRERVGDAGIGEARVLEVGVEDPAQDRGRARRGERQLPGGEPVQDGPEGEEVAPRVRVVPLDDLRRHVVGRPDQRAGHGHPLVGGEDAGDPEVGELHRGRLPVLHEDVLGLEVAVDHPGGVGVHERVGERAPDEHPDLREAEAHLLREGAERPPLHELGDEVALRRVLAGVVVDLDDARVREAGDGAGLAREAGPRLLGGGEVRVEELHRNLAVERGVAAAVHDRHAPAADLLEELVSPQYPDHAGPSEVRPVARVRPEAGARFLTSTLPDPPRDRDIDGGIEGGTMTRAPGEGPLHVRGRARPAPTRRRHQTGRAPAPVPGRRRSATSPRIVLATAAVEMG